jgi:hypothetical protein
MYLTLDNLLNEAQKIRAKQPIEMQKIMQDCNKNIGDPRLIVFLRFISTKKNDILIILLLNAQHSLLTNIYQQKASNYSKKIINKPI